MKSNTLVAHKRLLQVLLLSVAVIFLMQGVVMLSTAQSTEERVLEDKIPKHLPIKVKIKKEKEKAFKDLQNEKWARDLELEVTNIGDKPIYFLDFELVLPNVKSPSGYEIGFPLRYGRLDLIKLDTPLLPEDVPLLPGQTHIFKIREENAEGWEKFTAREKIPKDEPRRLQLEFYFLRFGDRTGFRSFTGVPFPNPSKKRSSNAPCKEQKGQSAAVAVVAVRSHSPDSSAKLSSSFLPANFLPVNFSSAEMMNSLSGRPPFQSGLCCPGTSCGYRKESSYTCICKSNASLTIATSCEDPDGICSIDRRVDVVCSDGVCPEFFLNACANPEPTPLPTPYPTPEPTPEPSPTPCPLQCNDTMQRPGRRLPR
jgi:hypothetical protein